jgi:hypothetical protein
MKRDNLSKRNTKPRWLLLITPPLAFLLKDVIATIAVLLTEPGITARAAFYYSIALLPGTLFVNSGEATLLNIFVGAVVGLLLYLWARLHAQRAA